MAGKKGKDKKETARRPDAGREAPAVRGRGRPGRVLPRVPGEKSRPRLREQSSPGLKDKIRPGPAVLLVGGIALSAVLAGGPFFRGLFFPGEYLIAQAVILAIFAGLYAYIAGGGREWPRTILEWAALAFVVSYWIVLPVAVVPRAALAEALKYTSYLAAFWMVSRLTRSPGWRLAVLVALVLAGVGVAVLGLGAAAGTFAYRGAFEGGRICSSLQYPNTAATYLTATLVLGAGLAGVLAGGGEPGRRQRGRRGTAAGAGWYRLGAAANVLLAGGLAVAFLAFVFTMSRGGWLVFPVLAAALAVLLPPGGRAVPLLTLVAAVAGGMVAVPFLGSVLAGPRGTAVWTYAARAFLAGAALQALGQVILGRLSPGEGMAGPAFTEQAVAGPGVAEQAMAGPGVTEWSVGQRGRTARVAVVGVALAVLVLLGAAGAVWRLHGEPASLAALVPQQLRQRAAAINLSESGAQDRLQWTRDALRLVMQRPILGAGGGGWNALYGTIQTYPYFSTEVHNHFAQVWVEVGTLGFLAYLAVWVGAAWAFYRIRFGGFSGERVLPTAAFVAAAGLGIHSVIDFNLSLPAVALMLWALLGVVSAGEGMSDPAGGPVARPGAAPGAARGTLPRAGRGAGDRKGTVALTPGWLRVAVPVLCLALVSLSVSLRVGYGAGMAGARALNEGKRDQALILFQKAMRFDPWTASYHIDAAQVLEGMGGADRSSRSASPGKDDPIKRAREEYERGVRLDPFNPQYRTIYGRFLLRTGDVQAGLDQLRTAVKCRPAVAAGYENLAAACLAVGKALVDNGKPESAVGYLQQVEAVARDMEGRAALAPAFVPAGRRTPALTPRLALTRGEASLLLGDDARARELLEKARGDKDTKVEANLLLAAWARLTKSDPTPFLKEAGTVPDADARVEQICRRVERLASR